MLMPEIDKGLDRPIYLQIHRYIAEAITSGKLQPDERLPSVRRFAESLGVSRTSIENAYGQLMAEGYIYSVGGGGYYAEALEMMAPPVEKNDHKAEKSEEKRCGYDFAGEFVAPEAFDFKLWKKHINGIINYESDALYSYGMQRGEPVLREALSKLFYRSRGVVASPEMIVIGSGVSPLLSMLTRLFREVDIQGVVLENPGFSKAYGVFLSGGMKVDTMEVGFKGINLEQLKTAGSRACYVSPSHHFPTGYVMPMRDRQKLLKWAGRRNGYIIEDDYNFELRFEGHPIPAMQAIDKHQRVIYLGSFSTVLAPAIRISFMVLPPELNELFMRHSGMFPQTASKLEQLALARLITSGDFDRHIRRIRKIYTRKQQTVLACLQRLMPENVMIPKAQGGLQVLIGLPQGVSSHETVEACRVEDVDIKALDAYRIGPSEGLTEYLVLSYRGIEETAIEEGIRRISGVIKAQMAKH